MSIYHLIREWQSQAHPAFAITDEAAAQSASTMAESKEYSAMEEILRDEDFWGVLWY